MIDLIFVLISFGVTFRNALCNDLLIAIPVTSILAIVALHSSPFEQEFPTQRTQNDSVELLRNEFVSILFVYLFLSLSYSSLST